MKPTSSRAAELIAALAIEPIRFDAPKLTFHLVEKGWFGSKIAKASSSGEEALASLKLCGEIAVRPGDAPAIVLRSPSELASWLEVVGLPWVQSGGERPELKRVVADGDPRRDPIERIRAEIDALRALEKGGKRFSFEGRGSRLFGPRREKLDADGAVGRLTDSPARQIYGLLHAGDEVVSTLPIDGLGVLLAWLEGPARAHLGG